MKSKAVLLCFVVMLSYVQSVEKTVKDYVDVANIAWYYGGEVCLSLFRSVVIRPYYSKIVYYDGYNLSVTLTDNIGYVFKVDLLTHDCHKLSRHNNILCGQFESNGKKYKKIKPINLSGYISMFDNVQNTVISQGNIDKNITRVKLTRPRDERFETKKVCKDHCPGVCHRTCRSVYIAGMDVTCNELQQEDTTIEQHADGYTSRSLEETTMPGESSTEQSTRNKTVSSEIGDDSYGVETVVQMISSIEQSSQKNITGDGEETAVPSESSTQQSSHSQPKVFGDGEGTVPNESSTQQSSSNQFKVSGDGEETAVPNDSSTEQSSHSQPKVFGDGEETAVPNDSSTEQSFSSQTKVTSDQKETTVAYKSSNEQSSMNHKLIMNDYFNQLKNHGKRAIASFYFPFFYIFVFVVK